MGAVVGLLVVGAAGSVVEALDGGEAGEVGVDEPLDGVALVGEPVGVAPGVPGDVLAVGDTVPAPGEGVGSAPAALTPHTARGAASVTDKATETADRIFMRSPGDAFLLPHQGYEDLDDHGAERW